MGIAMALNVLSFIGIIALCGIAWLTSENRRVMPWRTIAWGIGLQLILGLLVFQVPVTRSLLVGLSEAINSILDATEAGARFLFGPLFVPDGAFVPGPVLAGRWLARAIAPPYVPVPGDRLGPEFLNLGYVFAFRALPSVIFFSALTALLYALGLIQPIINLFARVFQRTMKLSGAEALSGASNIFVGIEATLVVRPYLQHMTRSELCAILASCFGSIASTVLALYAGLLRPVFPNITGHLVSASIMAIPACFVVAKIIVPETQTPLTSGQKLAETTAPQAIAVSPPVVSSAIPPLQTDAAPTLAPVDAPEGPPVPQEPPHPQAPPPDDPAYLGPMESIVVGAMDGVKLAVAIAALLVAILGLVALVNLFFVNLASLSTSTQPFVRGIGNVFQVISLQNLAGALFLPLTFLTGASLNWPELWQASRLIGQRLILTEIPSYQQLAVLSSQGLLSDRALVVVSYALCGFAHLPSLGIFVGGLVSLVPSRRREIVDLSWKALWAATLATLMIGCIAGLYNTGNPTIIGK